MVAGKNIIHKVQIEVNSPSLANGMHLKDGLSAYFKEEIFPEMDSYFNTLTEKDSKIVRFEVVSLEISVDDKHSLIDIKNLIIKELKNRINYTSQSQIPSESSKVTTAVQSESEAFLYFLENGNLPWWFLKEGNIWVEYFEKIEQDVQTLGKLKTLLPKAEIRKRLVYQFDDVQLFKIVASVLNISTKKNFEFKIPDKYRVQFWEALLLFSINKNETEVNTIFQELAEAEASEIQHILKNYFGLTINLATKKSKIKKPVVENIFKNENLENGTNKDASALVDGVGKEGLLVQNAGLILLHPFLKMFFERLDFIADKAIKPEKMDEAIHTLHYLATGREQAFEYELVFEKFLCNLPMHHPVNRHVFLTKEQKMACETLLVAVLGHWRALKSNSTEILQNEFIQREGKLTVSEDSQQLFVQRKTQDILLNKLPWSVHLIKIPWHKKILFVEW